MSRIRMAVEIRNESASTLVWDHDEVASGDWTDPWFPSRNSPIAPGQTTEWRCEGDLTVVATTGAEVRVWYTIDGDPNRKLYIHVDSPLIESQYGNTFHVFAPKGLDVAHTGGQGHDARLSVVVRASERRSVPGFSPSVNGLQFRNSWDADLPAMTLGFVWNRLLGLIQGPVASALGLFSVSDDWLPVTRADSGLCGGMVFAVKDYFIAGRLPPDRTTAPDSADDPLFQFIRARLRDSFDLTGSGHRWLGYSSPHYPDGDEGAFQAVGLTRGRSWITYREEWPRIRADIDAGQLSPAGLVQTDTLDIGKNHQVLVHAYQQDGQVVTLWLYDPNYPGRDDVRLQFDVTDTAGRVSVTRFGQKASEPSVYAIMRLDGYEPAVGPGARRPGVRQALVRATGHRDGVLPDDLGLPRPLSVAGWLDR